MEKQYVMYSVDKVTKGAIRYAPPKDSPFGVLYIRKEFFDGPHPDAIKVTIEEAK